MFLGKGPEHLACDEVETHRKKNSILGFVPLNHKLEVKGAYQPPGSQAIRSIRKESGTTRQE